MARFKLKEVATEKGSSISKLAATTGITMNTISRIWKGHTTQVSLVTLQKIADALGVKVTDLIEDNEDSKQAR